MDKELIQCDFEGPRSSGFVSVLDIHNAFDSWCGACALEPSKQIKLDSGHFNPYGCWRRSHTSGNLGFLMTSELKFGSGDRCSSAIREHLSHHHLLHRRMGGTSLEALNGNQIN